MEKSLHQINDPDPCEPLSGRHVIISINPKAGAGCSRARADRLAEILTEQGLTAQVETDLETIGNEACRLAKLGDLRALIGVGGDGTATELANRITPEVPLVIMAAGTENLLARHIGWPKLPEPLADVILNGRKICMDLGRAGNRLFLLMLSCGIDAEIVRRLDEGRSGHINHASYMGPIFKSVCHYKYPKIEIESDNPEKNDKSGLHERTEEDPTTSASDKRSNATWVVITNIPLYGGGVRFSPEADKTDGLLDICEFRGSGFLRSLGFYIAAKRGRCHKLKNCSARQATRIRLTADQPLPYQIDGDPGGTLPVDIELIPQALTLLVPK